MVSMINPPSLAEYNPQPGDFFSDREIIEIPLLLSKSHFQMLEKLSQEKGCTFAETFRQLLVKASRAADSSYQDIIF
ncbi:MAG: hypothetical protein EXR99_05405 [Gemmataceae bacterium]|nr:hypothetical protein [Gemmataceae bacterium]